MMKGRTTRKTRHAPAGFASWWQKLAPTGRVVGACASCLAWARCLRTLSVTPFCRRMPLAGCRISFANNRQIPLVESYLFSFVCWCVLFFLSGWNLLSDCSSFFSFCVNEMAEINRRRRMRTNARKVKVEVFTSIHWKKKKKGGGWGTTRNGKMKQLEMDCLGETHTHNKKKKYLDRHHNTCGKKIWAGFLTISLRRLHQVGWFFP